MKVVFSDSLSVTYTLKSHSWFTGHTERPARDRPARTAPGSASAGSRWGQGRGMWAPRPLGPVAAGASLLLEPQPSGLPGPAGTDRGHVCLPGHKLPGPGTTLARVQGPAWRPARGQRLENGLQA